MNATGKQTCKCPICGGDARWSVMKTGRVSITHGACGVQVFARGDEADEMMRDKFIAGGAEQAAPNVTYVQAAGEPAPVTYVQDGEGFGVWNS
ncbi:hypothetical protein E2553_43250 [Paraburkholderia dipogonis]|uniref:Uncharacterized protein n=1 Tax=Paraburkholderia dipogonis TaxID=1211383 RepID=A0A4Y8MGI2_9BURK|nr:hypothetical protein [Paraburkholderia dipogonis]TFE36547.1 hypothetical protein E2553_43250 [Paraburkholderia dipogonis]